MAEVTEIKVTVGGTINLGNYENVRREITLTAKVAAGEALDAAYEELSGTAGYMLAKDVAKLVEDQVPLYRLEDKDKNAKYISGCVEGCQSFDYLKMLSPAVAEALVEKYVTLYAAPEKPAEPAAEKSADAEIPQVETSGKLPWGIHDPADDDDYDLDEDDDLEDDFEDDDF